MSLNDTPPIGPPDGGATPPPGTPEHPSAQNDASDVSSVTATVFWKNTDVCIQMTCRCGGYLHFDGYFAYVLHCMRCNTQWKIPTELTATVVDPADASHVAMNVQPDDEEDESSVTAWSSGVCVCADCTRCGCGDWRRHHHDGPAMVLPPLTGSSRE